MKSRILSLAAIAGMLAATGCSGGGAGTAASGLTPVPPPTTGGTTTTRSASGINATFLVPVPGRSASSAGRDAQYLSPGTNGITVLLGNGAVYVPGNTGTSATASLAQTLPAASNGSQALNYTTPSNNTAPVVGQTLTIKDSAGANTSPACTITAVNLFNPGGVSTVTCTFGAATPVQYVPGNQITFVPTATNAGQQFLIGTQAQSLALAQSASNVPFPATYTGAAGAKYSYSFVPSIVAGYYVFSLNITGLVAGGTYVLGVVTNDFATNKVLSEGSTVATVLPALGGSNTVAATLLPVVFGLSAPPAALVYPPSNGSGGPSPAAALGTYETTLFATDFLGYVIPGNAGLPDNAASAVIAQSNAAAAGNLTFRTYATPGNQVALPLTAPPTGAATGITVAAATATFAANAIIGGYFNDIQSSTNTGTPILNLGPNATIGTPTTYASQNIAGNPLNIICGVATAGVAYKATITSAVPAVATVVGYAVTAGGNYPPTTTTVTLGTLDCTPGLGAVIN